MSFQELKEQYDVFLQNERFRLEERITTAIDDHRRLQSSGCPRVVISMAELRAQDLSNGIRENPLEHLRALETACHELASTNRAGYDKNNQRIKVALAGPVGASASSPRQLTSACLRQLVCVEGVATKVSTIKPKVVKSVHYCPNTKQHEEREYVDATDPSLGLKQLQPTGEEIPDRFVSITSSVYPTKDKENNPLETEFGLSKYKDHQTITLQEMPEKAPMGQLPRSVELILDHDLVDKVKPGDRVMIVGVYRALATSANGQKSSSGVFRTVVLVNHIQIIGRDVSNIHFEQQDIAHIRELAQRKDILDILGASVAPSIYGHSVIKKALALQLLSGVEKNLKNGTHLRGDINILMVGDPSTAKSQLLRSAMTIASLAVSTTGKGSSGVGLTAAVTSDPDTRERRLEAGAMVLADRGLVCVDEFDKMGENDRVAIHEAMEQQTVTIAKAGIHASLNARCSVLAAANPVYGQYDRRRRIQENIGLPDSLLSRFDLLFVVLDQMDPETDREIASHVVRGHRYRSGHGQAGYDSDDEGHESDFEDEDDPKARTNRVWQKTQDKRIGDVLHHDFLRKYIRYAKERIEPVLTNEAREMIANRYAEMRARQDERTLPVTARSLETVIRLASAHAKARLSHEVEIRDCEAAINILSFALYHEDRPEERPAKRTRLDEDAHEDDDEELDSAEAIQEHLAEVLSESPSLLQSRLKERILERIVEEACTLEDLEGDTEANQAALDLLVQDGLIFHSDDTYFAVQ